MCVCGYVRIVKYLFKMVDIMDVITRKSAIAETQFDTSYYSELLLCIIRQLSSFHFTNVHTVVIYCLLVLTLHVVLRLLTDIQS